MRLREAIVHPANPRSLAARARRRRWQMLLQRFPDIQQMSVIDLGGTVASWELIEGRPKDLTILNLDALNLQETRPWAQNIVGDACDPPVKIAQRRFDLVFSSSLIEHVGGHARRKQFAKIVRELGSAYWVSAPYRYFPIEPHWLTPAFQHLPVAIRTALAQRWPRGYPSRVDAVEDVLSVELPDATMMRHYFPDADLLFERFLTLPKSVIAVRSFSRV